MPASAPAPISGTKPPEAMITKGLLLLLFTFLAGCDSSGQEDQASLEPPVNLASVHAESKGEEVAAGVVFHATEMILLHPASTRQRISRENLLFMDELKDRLPARNPPPELIE